MFANYQCSFWFALLAVESRSGAALQANMLLRQGRQHAPFVILVTSRQIQGQMCPADDAQEVQYLHAWAPHIVEARNV